jgi:hypothetical protein
VSRLLVGSDGFGMNFSMVIESFGMGMDIVVQWNHVGANFLIYWRNSIFNNAAWLLASSSHVI